MQSPASNPLIRTRQGDSEAFGEFYDQNARTLFSWFRRRTASVEVAADLTSESFAEALRSLPSYDPQRGSPTQWLYGIAWHQLHSWWRSERIQTEARDRLGIHLPLPDEDATDLVAMRTDLETLVGPLGDALAELTEPVREAVVARVVRELSYSEIAAELDCTAGAARVRVSRGLTQLQSHLQEAGVSIG